MLSTNLQASKSEQTSPFSKLESFQTLTHWSTIPGSFMVFSKGERSYQGEKPHSWLMLTGQYHCQVWCSRLLAALACARKLYVYTFASFSWGKRASNLWLSPQKMNATSRRQALLNDEWVLAVNSGTDVKCRGCQRVIRLGKPYELGETSEQLSSDHRKEENPLKKSEDANLKVASPCLDALGTEFDRLPLFLAFPPFFAPKPTPASPRSWKQRIL